MLFRTLDAVALLIDEPEAGVRMLRSATASKGTSQNER